MGPHFFWCESRLGTGHVQSSSTKDSTRCVLGRWAFWTTQVACRDFLLLVSGKLALHCYPQLTFLAGWCVRRVVYQTPTWWWRPTSSQARFFWGLTGLTLEEMGFVNCHSRVPVCDDKLTEQPGKASSPSPSV